MLIKPGKHLHFILAALWIGAITIMMSWWGYLIYQTSLNPDYIKAKNLSSLILWESIAFITVITLLSFSLLYIYLADKKKTASLQSFFASLGHELKTPLTSMRLQSQFIEELARDQENPQLSKLSLRLIEDTLKFENELERALGLSRLLRDASSNLSEIDLLNFVTKEASTYPSLNLSIQSSKSPMILFDEYALKLILRNLFENTFKHTPQKEALIEIKQDSHVQLIYSDTGQFKGDLKKLTTLFYKHNSSSGTGIGLHLISELIKRSNGQFQIETEPKFKIIISFNR